MSRLDLHIHTSASDGTLTAKELICEIINSGIDVFAVCDHDNIDNIAQTAVLSLRNGLSYIPASEISAYFNGKVFHILCYGCDFSNAGMRQILLYNQSVWADIDIARIEWVSRIDALADPAEFEGYSYDSIRGGWRSLNYMIDKGIIRDMKEYFSLHADFYIDKKFCELPEVISAAINSGGLPFLAHPAYSKDKGEKYMSINLLNELLKCGIKGIECYNIYNHSKEEEQYYLSYAKEKNLHISGGSDYHGGFITERKIGEPYVSSDMIGSKWYEDLIIKD
jgi:predicted metal-dependent phosphoesterase TrpH